MVLTDENKNLRYEAVRALAKIASPAVKPLCAALKDADKEVRQRVAEAVVRLYRSGNLGPDAKRVIWSYQRVITEKHTDQSRTITHSWGIYSDCHDDTWHEDAGIGVSFVF